MCWFGRAYVSWVLVKGLESQANISTLFLVGRFVAEVFKCEGTKYQTLVKRVLGPATVNLHLGI